MDTNKYSDGFDETPQESPYNKFVEMIRKQQPHINTFRDWNKEEQVSFISACIASFGEKYPDDMEYLLAAIQECFEE
jgi:hypothetical protein